MQKDAVGQYERALQQASDKLQECYARQGDYAQRLEEAKTRQAQLKQEVASAAATYKQYRGELGETDSATIAARSNLCLLYTSQGTTSELGTAPPFMAVRVPMPMQR